MANRNELLGSTGIRSGTVGFPGMHEKPDWDVEDLAKVAMRVFGFFGGVAMITVLSQVFS